MLQRPSFFSLFFPTKRLLMDDRGRGGGVEVASQQVSERE